MITTETAKQAMTLFTRPGAGKAKMKFDTSPTMPYGWSVPGDGLPMPRVFPTENHADLISLSQILMCWTISPTMCGERECQLHKTGFTGLSFAQLSPYEAARIRAFAAGRGKTVCRIDRIEAGMDTDYAFKRRVRCLAGTIWLKHDEDIAAFKTLLNEIPPRSCEFLIENSRFTPDLRERLKGKNWTQIRSDREEEQATSIFSCESCKEAVYVRMMCSADA
jgi:hypothetical protein